MRKGIVTTLSMALLVSLSTVNVYGGYDRYDKGWDYGYHPGAEEAQDDVCDGRDYHIDEEFSDASSYDRGWEKGFRKGYDYFYKKGCQTANENENENNFEVSQSSNSELTQDVIDSLAYMGNEERLAYDIYTVLYNYHDQKGTQINQLANIPKSEKKHVEIVQDIIQKYDINTDNLTDVDEPVADKDVAFEDMPMGVYDVAHIQDLYDMLYDKGIESKQAALEVGCIVEVVDIDDLDKFIIQAEVSNATDIVDAFNILRDGSYKHFWAFDEGLKKMGVSEGCAVLGADYAKTTEEYPNIKGGNGGSI